MGKAKPIANRYNITITSDLKETTLDDIEQLVLELAKLPNETEWVEFKQNNDDPATIGENISALANGAALIEKPFAYIIWGLNDDTHEVEGTEFDYRTAKKGNEELPNWLRHQLSQNADFDFYGGTAKGKQIVVLRITAAAGNTVMFEKIDRIRINGITKKLNDYPEVKAKLWNRLQRADFECQIAMDNLDASKALNLLNWMTYFELTGSPPPSSQDEILRCMLEEKLIVRQDDGRYSITNMGALLFAKRLRVFPTVSRKALRIIQYMDKDKLNMQREREGEKGYANEFEELIKYIKALTPAEEVIEGGLRETVTAFAPISIRESVGNALIHQDLALTGTGPMVEIFSNRIEIANPGRSLVEVEHLIDNPPNTRNEKMASLMRRMHIGEEAGTGWDKIVGSCELQQLPAPNVILYSDFTIVKLYPSVPFSSMSHEDRLRACYQHAVLRYVEGAPMSNSSLRERLGLEQTMTAKVSRLIKDAREAGMIKPLDSDSSKKFSRYVPSWA
jgi:predicted HTH transcriptional regulator